MKNLLSLTLLSMLIPIVAHANCRAPHALSKIVYSEAFTSGQRSATVNYIIIGTSDACEFGAPSTIGHPVDTRNCSITVSQRFFTRDIIVTVAGKPPTNVGRKMVSLPDQNTHPSDNCNSAINDGHWSNLDANALGDKSTWQANIDADEGELQSILSLVGLIKQ